MFDDKNVRTALQLEYGPGLRGVNNRGFRKLNEWQDGLTNGRFDDWAAQTYYNFIFF